MNGSRVLSSIVYDPFGPARQWTWGNGTLTNRTYDQDGKLTQVDSAGLNTYTFDDAFRITGNTDTANSALSWTYGYSVMDRLTSAANSTLTQSWTYDNNGNRLTQGGTTSTTFTNASASNRLNTTTGALARSYTYDASGHTTSDGSRSFTYNAAGRMITATSSSVTTTYAYNALGQRVKKSNASGTSYFVYDEAGHLLGEYDQNGTLIEELVWLGDIPVATIMPNGSSIGFFYVHADQLNAPAKITRPSDNAIIWRWDHDAFGNGAPNQDPDGNSAIVTFNLRYPGQYFDQETGLLHNGFRDYDPSTGRYLQSDPIGLFGGVNTYAYVGGNPLTYSDPFGLEATPLPGIPGLPIYIPPQPAFTPGTKEYNNLVNAGTRALNDLLDLIMKKDGSESKPENCPSGTVPIDEAKKKLGIGKDDVHGIKKWVGAGPRTWTGIDPKGNVWTRGRNGVGENHGPFKDYLP